MYISSIATLPISIYNECTVYGIISFQIKGYPPTSLMFYKSSMLIIKQYGPIAEQKNPAYHTGLLIKLYFKLKI